MNPVWQIAYDQLSIDELEDIVAQKRKEQGSLKAMTDEEIQINEYRKYFRSLKKSKI